LGEIDSQEMNKTLTSKNKFDEDIKITLNPISPVPGGGQKSAPPLKVLTLL